MPSRTCSATLLPPAAAWPPPWPPRPGSGRRPSICSSIPPCRFCSASSASRRCSVGGAWPWPGGAELGAGGGGGCVGACGGIAALPDRSAQTRGLHVGRAAVQPQRPRDSYQRLELGDELTQVTQGLGCFLE